jgi:hypothetical protein
MYTIDQLYRSYDPDEGQDFVFDHRYNDDTIVALRPFSIEKDLSTFNQWVNEELHIGNKKFSDPSYVDGSYFRTTLRISNAQSLWGLVNNKASFQVDLYKAIQYHLPFREKGLMLTEGDVFLKIIIASSIINLSLAEWILPASIDHCFNHTGVRRVMMATDAQDIYYRQLAEKASPASRLQFRNGRSVYFYEDSPGRSAEKSNTFHHSEDQNSFSKKK